MKYLANYKNGMIEELEATTLEAAMEEADRQIGYTQRNVVIEDESGNELARRTWYGVKPSEEDLDDEGIIQIGNGFYTSWSW